MRTLLVTVAILWLTALAVGITWWSDSRIKCQMWHSSEMTGETTGLEWRIARGQSCAATFPYTYSK